MLARLINWVGGVPIEPTWPTRTVDEGARAAIAAILP
jgi:hypothetical protein